jgi:hypothetical protein
MMFQSDHFRDEHEHLWRWTGRDKALGLDMVIWVFRQRVQFLLALHGRNGEVLMISLDIYLMHALVR